MAAATATAPPPPSTKAPLVGRFELDSRNYDSFGDHPPEDLGDRPDPPAGADDTTSRRAAARSPAAMASPPRCPVTGRHVRYLLLAAFLSWFVYFLVHGLQEPPSSRTIYVCDTEGTSAAMTQCESADDVATCANLVDASGNVASCVASSCGYRLFPHLDVSIAGSSDPYDPEGAAPPTTFLSVMAIFYSVVPYLVGFVYMVHFLASGNLAPFTRLVVMGVIGGVNEFVFKEILEQRRPEGSCLYFGSYGMPSGHSATSIGLLTYLLLELLVYHPDLLCGLTCQRQRGEGGDAYSYTWGYGWHAQSIEAGSDAAAGPTNDSNGASDTFKANAPADSVAIDVIDVNDGGASEEPLLDPPFAAAKFGPGKWYHHLVALGCILLLFPVPFSRVYLHDHTRSQVLYGALVGIGASSLWYIFFIRNCGLRIARWTRSEWGKWWGFQCGQGGGCL